jgi:mycothiol synthase
MSQALPQLVMRRSRLDDLPEAVPPPGYQIRSFEESDESGWNEVLWLAFEWEPGQGDFETIMRSHSAYDPERVKVVVTEQGQVVATASCWSAAKFDDDHRMLHYVAVHPEHRGHRLGHIVSLAAMHHAVAEGAHSMALLTDDFRDAAIKTYLRMGFVPLVTHRSHPERWRLIEGRLGWSSAFDE